MGRPAMGRPGPARGRLPAGRLDGPRRPARGPDRDHLRLPVRDRPAARARHATRGRADAGGLHRSPRSPSPSGRSCWAWPCFAVTLLLVTDRRAHPGRLWIVPVLVAIWANLHGSFFLGPVVLGLAWLEDVHDHAPGARRVLFVTLVSAAAACLTPFGPLVWGYAVGLSVNPEVTERITEWQPTSLRTVPGLLFFGSVAAVVVLIARRGERTSWPTPSLARRVLRRSGRTRSAAWPGGRSGAVGRDRGHARDAASRDGPWRPRTRR